MPFAADNPDHQKTAAGLAGQLLAQIDQRVASMPNDPDKFLMKGKLAELSEALKVREISSCFLFNS